MSLKTPPWGTNNISQWNVDEQCHKCNEKHVVGVQSHYSGVTYYFCQVCGTDYPDESEGGSEEEEESNDESEGS